MTQNNAWERIMVDCPPGTKSALDRLAASYGLCRADVIREAFCDLLDRQEFSFSGDLAAIKPDLAKLRATIEAETP